ncbi:MAG: acetyl-CoA carboxylase biotin carboxyl carrier protein subunit [Chloroflexota bacterium]
MSTNPDTLRLTVAGPEELVVDVQPADLAPAPAGRSPEVRSADPNRTDRADGRRRFEVTVDGWVLSVGVESASRAILRERAAKAAAASGPAGRAVIKAQIPGRVVRLWVAPGDQVEAGQRLLAIEAMKMENEVRSPRAGTVESVSATLGNTVELGDELLVVG